jgi:putative membrane protein
MKDRPLLALIVRWLVLALGVTLAEKLVDGVDCKDGATLFVVVVLLSFFNAVLRPVLVLFTLPFIVLTMGLGLVVINALLFLLVGKLVPGFEVAGFGSAFWAAVIVGLTNFFMTLVMKQRPPGGPGGGGGGGGSGGTGERAREERRLPRRERGGGDVIDV